MKRLVLMALLLLGGSARATYRSEYENAVRWCKTIDPVGFPGYYGYTAALAMCADTYMRYNYKPEVKK